MKPPATRRAAVALATIVLAAAGSVVLGSQMAFAAAPTATFTKTSSWDTGYTGQYTVTNGATTAMNGWTVEFDLPSTTTVGSFWDALITRSGNHYTAKNREYNGNVAPGASVTFGWVASGTASPANCKLNGGPCGGGSPAPTTTTGPPAPTPSRTTTPRPSPTSTPPPPPFTPRAWPYVDITMSTPTLTQVANATGHKFFTLAFVLGSAAGCDPSWGAQLPLTEPRIINDIRNLKNMGGDVTVAFGGAVGPYLEHSCGSVTALAGAYTKVIDTLGIKHLDVDIEASVNVDMMNKALAKVQRDRPGTTVSFTLMVQGDDFGLTPVLGVDLLRSAKSNGVRVDVVNPMTMEFGSSRAWGDAVIAAAGSTLRQMAEIWPEKTDGQRKRMLGVTPMIGRNFNGRIFTQAHAQQLVTWANTNHIQLLAFWSVGRDNGGCPGGAVSATCSSISQSTFEFTNIFKGFHG
jgi:chitinase